MKTIYSLCFLLSFSASAQQAPLVSTLSDLSCSKLEAYYAVPTPGTPSTTTSNQFTPDAIKQLNEAALHRYAVDIPNSNTLSRYDFVCKSWEQAKTSILPTPPAYVVFDVNGFDQWWAQYTANLGDAPPLFFIKPAVLPLPPILFGSSAPPPPPALDGPIGAAVPNNPGVFNPSPTDNFPDGYIYAGASGVYQKHIFNNPFTSSGTRVIWVKVA